MLSQKAELIEASQREMALQGLELGNENSEKYSIEDILGVVPDEDDKKSAVTTDKQTKKKGKQGKNSKPVSVSKKSQFEIANNEERISNSNSPLINESL